MWFTYRGGDDTYRIGSASSHAGLEWERGEGVAFGMNAGEIGNGNLVGAFREGVGADAGEIQRLKLHGIVAD